MQLKSQFVTKQFFQDPNSDKQELQEELYWCSKGKTKLQLEENSLSVKLICPSPEREVQLQVD